jgi:hypothetical protein
VRLREVLSCATYLLARAYKTRYFALCKTRRISGSVCTCHTLSANNTLLYIIPTKVLLILPAFALSNPRHCLGPHYHVSPPE